MAECDLMAECDDMTDAPLACGVVADFFALNHYTTALTAAGTFRTRGEPQHVTVFVSWRWLWS